MFEVRIMLATTEVMRDMYFSRADGAQQKLIKNNLSRYLTLPPMFVCMNGEDAAEAMFDLTNNPSRQEERMAKYGNGRSLSVGDVVEVAGTKFACLSMGWEKI
jgi:hypothetical protein